MTLSKTQAARLRERYGPCALVTGASDGIGRAFAETLAAAGFDLLLVARRGARLTDLAARLETVHGVQAEPLALDLGAPTAGETLAHAAAGRDIGLLVAAAGFGTSGPLLQAMAAEELAMIDVNCRAVSELLLRLTPRLAARGRGGIVLMSSLLAFQGVPRAATYAATKAFIQTLAEGLRLELAPAGVDVVASAPGPIHSGFAARAGMTMALAQTPEIVAAATLAALGRRGTVRPGWLSKALEASFTGLPRRARAQIMARVMLGMTRRSHGATHQEGPRSP